MRNLFFLLLLMCAAPALAQTWVPLGPGIGYSGQSPEYLQSYGSRLYAGGYLSIAGDVQVNSIAAFDGNTWDALGIGTDGAVHTMLAANGNLYVAGNFCFMNGQPNTYGVVRWDGSQWYSLNTNLCPGLLYSLAFYNGELYVGGNFTQIGSITVNRIARFDGTNWLPVGTGVQGGIARVTAMQVYNGELYVGGVFSTAGGIQANCIARWNGTQWDSVAGGANSIVESMAVDTANNLLYVGGGFTMVDDTLPAWCIASWNGSSWSNVGTRATIGCSSLLMFNNELYASGYSATASQTDTVFARWDGNTWHPILGINNSVKTLAEHDGNIYVGGHFDTINNMPANHIACYGNTCPEGVGIPVIAAGPSFSIYPNPSTGVINVTISSAADAYSVTIYDQLGRKSKTIDNVTSHCEIDPSPFPKGMYMVELCNKRTGRCHTEKLILN